MPFTAAEIQDAGKIGLDFYLKNNPIDQVKVERPLLRRLMQTKRNFPGAKQFVVEQLRITYGSNFQWFYGTQVVTYNRRQSIEQSNFPWRGAHDGFFLDEDRLLQNGISITDDAKGGANSRAERLMLTNLIDEQSTILRLGFEEKFDFEIHLDGTQHPEALAGLDHLISTTPAVGVVGGIDRAANPWWRNHVFPGLTLANMVDTMEQGTRACSRNGGKPNFMLAG
ncbi:MAG: phage major capsid protein, partial [Gammaproteobacteria bacterium]